MMATKVVERLRTSERTTEPSEKEHNFKEESTSSKLLELDEEPKKATGIQSTKTDVVESTELSRGETCNSDTGNAESKSTKGDELNVEKSTVEGSSTFIPKVPESPPNRKPRPSIGKTQSPKEEPEADSHHGPQSPEEKIDQKSKGSKQSILTAKDEGSKQSILTAKDEGSKQSILTGKDEGKLDAESLGTLPSPSWLKEDKGKAASEEPSIQDQKGKAALEEPSIQKGATPHEDAVRRKLSDAGISPRQKVTWIKSRKCNLDEDLEKDFLKQEAPRKSLGGLGWFKAKETNAMTSRPENSKFPQRNQYGLFLFSTKEKDNGQGVRKVFAEANKTTKKDSTNQVEDVEVDDVDIPDWQSWDEGGLSRQVSASSCTSNASSVALSESPSVCRIRTFLRRCRNGSTTSMGDP
jgi:hypothetical protein